MNRYSFEYIKKIIEKNDYKVISDYYKNNLQKLILQCPENHIFPMSFKMFNKGHRCSYCANKRQYNIDEVRGFFEEKGYKLLSKEYNGNKSHLEVIGPDDKVYETTLFSFKVAGIIPHLKGNLFKNEEETRYIFEQLYNKPFPKTKPDWLLNPKSGRLLELDGYNEDLKIAFEYDGRQHFQDETFLKEGIGIRYERDLIKQKLCKDNNVTLIKIPFYIKDKYSYIENKLKYKNTLYIGDPHVKISNLESWEKLIDFIEIQAKINHVSKIVFLGDLFNDHSVVRLEVAHFWKNTINRLKCQYDLHILCGNHDMVMGSSEHSGLTAISLLEKLYEYNVIVINNPTIVDNIGYIPYIHDEEEFLKAAKDLYEQGATKMLIAHQTFNGAEYDNGFYAPNGIDLNSVPQKAIISGHIHKHQEFGKCLYLGTSTWETRSDANQDKGIWLCSHQEDGTLLSKKMIPTKGVVTSIVEAKIKEGDVLPAVPNGCKFYVELIGTTEWIKKTKEHYRGSAAIKSTYTDTKNSSRKPLGAISLEEFATKHFDITVNKEALFEALKDL